MPITIKEKLITEKGEEKIQLAPNPDGHVEKLPKEFINKQIGDANSGYTRNVAVLETEKVRLAAIDTTGMDKRELEAHNEEVDSCQRNLTKCKAKLLEYKNMKKLFTA